MKTVPKPDPTEDEILDDDLDEEVDGESQDETELDEDQEEVEDGETDEEADDNDQEDSDDDDSNDEDDETATQRFTQFKGDSIKEYLKNLEEGYINSSKEAVKLVKANDELKATVDRVNQLIATNPDLAEKLKPENGAAEPVVPRIPQDPALAFAQSQMQKVWKEEYDTFVEDHPEIETDPQLAQAVDQKLKIAKRIVEEEEGRLVGMGEALDMAWKLLGKDNNQKEDLAMAAKDSASQGKASGGKKATPGNKPKFSDKQIEIAMDMLQVDREEAIKQLSTFN